MKAVENLDGTVNNKLVIRFRERISKDCTLCSLGVENCRRIVRIRGYVPGRPV